jgi:EAL domain-containing protein (putative c-di-GMP-specific phosphodiesterase class I)
MEQASAERARPVARAPFSLADLQASLDSGAFFVEYQPKVALLGNATSQFGVEALCRIDDPTHGVVAPDQFIALAEKHALMERLTDGVARRAFAAWRQWAGAGLHIRMALNISPLLLAGEEWCQGFLTTCSEFSIDPKWITLEITETAAGATDRSACEILRRLQQRGFSLSIDDFGTGFSSLATLYKLPVTEMKIDKSFIFDLQANAGARELVESAIGMAKRLGIKVVAEGVENEAVFRELRRMGCDEAQGYFIGKSMKADSVVPFFTRWSKAAPGDSGGAQALPRIVVAQALLNDLVADLSAPVRPAANSYARFASSRDVMARPREIVEKIPALVLGGKPLPALAHCQEALSELGAMAGSHQIVEKLRQVQAQLEHELMTPGELELKSAYETVRLLPRASVAIGRANPVVRTDIMINCRWLGTGDRNLRVFRDGSDYFLEDLGSINGCLLDGERLKLREPVEIPFGRSLVEPRLLSGAIAPLAIQLHRKSSDPDAIAIRLEGDKDILRADLSESDWQEIRSRLGVTWIVFSGEITIGRSSDCAVVISDCGLPVAGRVSHAGGLRIEPQAGANLEIDTVAFRQGVPLVAGAQLLLAGAAIESRAVPLG